MMHWIVNRIFAITRSLRVSASKFNHCSSVCPINSPRGTLLAWYSGSGECQNDQSVHVVFITGLRLSTPLRIGNCTGNPVLIPNQSNQNEAVLLWSKFENPEQHLRIVDRWKTCSLWTQRIGVCGGNVVLLGEPNKIAGPEQHLLGRCNPLVVDDTVLLPLYDEMRAECVIFRGNGLEYTESDRFGTNMIQPTIWKRGNTICSLSRNFRSNRTKSRYCDSIGGCWTEATNSNIWNLNNSLQVITWNGDDIILWNNTYERWRKMMTLGVLEYDASDLGFLRISAKPIEVVGRKYGAYPSMCIDFDGNLNFSFTSATKEIEYHVWNRKAFEQRRDGLTRRTRARNRNPGA
jgi:hypothetical protein